MMTLNRRIFSGFLLASIVLCLLSAFIYRSFIRYQVSTEWVSHTYLVIEELDKVLSGLKDVSNAQRGYVITGQQNYLTPYEMAVPQIEAHFAKLDELVNDNPRQKANLQALKGPVHERVDHAAEIIDTFKTKGQDAAFELVKSGTGKRELDDVQERVRVMQEEELRLLELRKAEVEASADHTLTVGAGGLAVCILILMAVFWLVWRESRQRTRTEAALQTAVEQANQLTLQTQTISRMGDYLQSCGELKEAFAIVATHIPFLLPGTRGVIGTYNNSRNTISVSGQWGEVVSTAPEFMPEDCWALRRGNPHYTALDSHEPQCKHIHNPPAGGVMCLPMQAHGEVHGLLCIEADDPALLTGEKETLIRSVAEQTSLALANLRLQEKLRVQSLSDPLTALYNRRYMESTLEREISRAYRQNLPLAVLVLDVDHFKKFNDTWGHEAGDAVLIAFAKVLKQKTRNEDVACRFGGEEFVLILPGASEAIAVQRAEAICEAVRAMQVSFKGQTMGSVSISIGVAIFPEHGASPDELIANADAALYRAKKDGRDRVVVSGAAAIAKS